MNIQVLNIKVLVNAGKRTRKLFFWKRLVIIIFLIWYWTELQSLLN